MYGTNHGIPGIRKYDPDFRLLDMRFRYNSESVYNTFDKIGLEGIKAYKKYLIFDFIFIACFLIVMIAVTLWITDNIFIIYPLIGFASLRAVFDIFENTFIIILINNYPEQNTFLADICSWTTTLKFMSLYLWLAGITLVMAIKILNI